MHPKLLLSGHFLVVPWNGHPTWLVDEKKKNAQDRVPRTLENQLSVQAVRFLSDE